MASRRIGSGARRIGAEEAAGLVRSAMWLDYGATLCQPDVSTRRSPRARTR